jgi:hypothetical protein
MVREASTVMIVAWVKSWDLFFIVSLRLTLTTRVVCSVLGWRDLITCCRHTGWQS